MTRRRRRCGSSSWARASRLAATWCCWTAARRSMCAPWHGAVRRAVQSPEAAARSSLRTARPSSSKACARCASSCPRSGTSAASRASTWLTWPTPS
eukprot:1303689-Lingulodinium_polyedra.AAC.1